MVVTSYRSGVGYFGGVCCLIGVLMWESDSRTNESQVMRAVCNGEYST